MVDELSRSAQKVQDALQDLGLAYGVVELPQSTRTVADAARAVGCDEGQIVKSLVFKTRQSGEPVLVIASGSNRVNEKKIGALVSEGVKMADADFVRRRTGFAIGGVPPLGHAEPLQTFIDEDLLLYDQVWAAAGTPRAVFDLDPRDLPRMTGGRVVSIT